MEIPAGRPHEDVLQSKIPSLDIETPDRRSLPSSAATQQPIDQFAVPGDDHVAGLHSFTGSPRRPVRSSGPGSTLGSETGSASGSSTHRRRPRTTPPPPLRTGGFILLQRWHTLVGDRLDRLEAHFNRTSKTQYKIIKQNLQQEQQSKLKSAASAMSADMKQRVALVLKLRAAGRTIWAVRNAMGAEDYSRATKGVRARHQLAASPELAAVILLQARFRRAQPLASHPGLESNRPLGVRFASLWAAHIAVCRVARARAASDLHFLGGFPVAAQLRFLRAARAASSRDPAAQLRALFRTRTPAVAAQALVLEAVAARALRRRSWAHTRRAAARVSSWGRAALARLALLDRPPVSAAVRALLSDVRHVTALGNHCARLARAHLSGGNFSRAATLLRTAQAEVELATARDYAERVDVAGVVLHRACLLFYRRRISKVGRLRLQLSAIERDYRAKVEDGAGQRLQALMVSNAAEVRFRLLEALAELALRGMKGEWRHETEEEQAAAARASLDRTWNSEAGRAARDRLPPNALDWTPGDVAFWIENCAGLAEHRARFEALGDASGSWLMHQHAKTLTTNPRLLLPGPAARQAALAIRAEHGESVARARRAWIQEALQDAPPPLGAAAVPPLRAHKALGGVAAPAPSVGKPPSKDEETAPVEAPREDLIGKEWRLEGRRVVTCVLLDPAGKVRRVLLPAPHAPARASSASSSDDANEEHPRAPDEVVGDGATPRAWVQSMLPYGARTQHLRQSSGNRMAFAMYVGDINCESEEEKRAFHSFDELGCLCEHNWICPTCFAWTRSQTSFDGLECGWCGRSRPQQYHPPTWQSQGALGADMFCPVKILLQQAQRGTFPAEVAAASLLAPPRASYPWWPKHPLAVSQRDGGDAPKLQAETDAIASGIGIDDEGELETHDFTVECEDIVSADQAGAEHEAPITDHFEWNPVRRFVLEPSKEQREAVSAAANQLRSHVFPRPRGH